METQEKKRKLKKVIITLDKQEEGIELGLHLKRVSHIEAGAMLAWAKDKLLEELKNNPESTAKEIARVLGKALDKAIESAQKEEALDKAAKLEKLAKKAAKKAAKKTEG